MRSAIAPAGPAIFDSTWPAEPSRLVSVKPGQAHSGLISDRLRGVLRSRSFTIEARYIHWLVAGRGGRINVVVDGFEKIRDPIYGALTRKIDVGDQPRWVTQDLGMWLGHSAYLEISDGGTVDFDGANARTRRRPRPDRGRRDPDVESVRAGGVTHRRGGPARRCDRGRGRSGRGRSPTCEDGRAMPRSPIGWRRPLHEARAIDDAACRTDAWPWRSPMGRARTSISTSEAVTKTWARSFPGGSWRFWAARDSSTRDAGSGRLELARRMVDPAANPLTPRVLVNRLWKHHFGEGIVKTTDDFGAMGRKPSHPELLDWLAAEFVGRGWSIKAMHRLMVTSSTYRMVSVPQGDAERLDPTNAFLHRMNVRRLEAEAIRDSLLAVSGRLEPSMYGPSVPVHLTSFMEGRGRPGHSGPLDGDGRRSLYLNVRRNFLDPMFLAFDMPVPFSTMGRRNVSNVPAQALTLMNDPMVVGQARLWAKRVIGGPGQSARARLDAALRDGLRPPADRSRSPRVPGVPRQPETGPTRRHRAATDEAEFSPGPISAMCLSI